MIDLSLLEIAGIVVTALMPIYAMLWKMLIEMTELHTIVQLCPYCQERRTERETPQT